MTIESLEALFASLNLIEIWLKLLDNNYGARRVAYSTAMKEMFKHIYLMMTTDTHKIPDIEQEGATNAHKGCQGTPAPS